MLRTLGKNAHSGGLITVWITAHCVCKGSPASKHKARCWVFLPMSGSTSSYRIRTTGTVTSPLLSLFPAFKKLVGSYNFHSHNYAVLCTHLPCIPYFIWLCLFLQAFVVHCQALLNTQTLSLCLWKNSLSLSFSNGTAGPALTPNQASTSRQKRREKVERKNVKRKRQRGRKRRQLQPFQENAMRGRVIEA